jgi:hypothetical protein
MLRAIASQGLYEGIDTTFSGLVSGSIQTLKTAPPDDEIRGRFPGAETPASHSLYPQIDTTVLMT